MKLESENNNHHVSKNALCFPETLFCLNET